MKNAIIDSLAEKVVGQLIRKGSTHATADTGTGEFAVWDSESSRRHDECVRQSPILNIIWSVAGFADYRVTGTGPYGAGDINAKIQTAHGTYCLVSGKSTDGEIWVTYPGGRIERFDPDAEDACLLSLLDSFQELGILDREKLARKGKKENEDKKPRPQHDTAD